ncbi:hypothetical protein APD12_18180 [Acinetobacter pittii]|nr:hypothetical protein APD12_18180 [Acinetobacter pittii]
MAKYAAAFFKNSRSISAILSCCLSFLFSSSRAFRSGEYCFVPAKVQLWTGADNQLNKLYAQDWRAEGRGIYLVLWFGLRTDNKKLKSRGKGKLNPTTADQLKEMLIESSQAAKSGQIEIVVLDIERLIYKI